jgi:hypothetical protein
MVRARSRPGSRWLAITLVACLLVATASCVRFVNRTAERAEARDWSGFLDDYSRLQPGDPGDLPFVYRSPNAQWKSYDAVLFEPVTLWRSGKHSLDPIPEDDLLALVAHFERAVRTRLGTGFRMVTAPGPGVLRLRLAITEARAADPVVDVLTATPEDADRRATGPIGPELAAFIEAAMIEGEIRDAASDELLAQGVDRRQAGAPRLATWEALDRALAFWADRVCSRLEARTRRR